MYVRIGKIAITLLILFLLAGCGKAEPATPTTAATPSLTPIPHTATPEPSSTAIPVLPLSDSGGGVIAFTSERDGEGDIYVMNADGSDPRRLTDDPAYDAWPTWSPDGSQIAFASTRSGNPDIYVMDVDGAEQGSGNVRQLTHHTASDIWPEWSPDGTRIAFPSRRDGNLEIYVIDADGTNLQRLTNTPSHEDFPAWSPDGTRIVFSRIEGNDGTYVMNADGSDEHKLTDIVALEPAWSPDGTRIAFGSDHEGFRAIYVIDADGSNLQKLSSTRAGENCPAWSPDGTRITFASWRDGDGEIYVMDADGGNLQQLTDNRFADEFPAWRPVATVASSAEAATLSDTRIRSTDGMVMVYVPRGEFQMGSTDVEVDVALEMCSTYYEDCERAWLEVEQPVHTVELDGFWIDQTEVTNGQYQLCVEAGACDPPREAGSDTRSTYYGDSAYDDYPVVNVNWHQADGYCAWAGGRLPTEAEWEYAARGPAGRRFPWGDEYDGTKLNSCDVNCGYSWAEGAFDDGHADTAPVGSYPTGASWCGALDLAGNVWEWMADWFGEYPSGRQVNPIGPPSGTSHSLRGDSADGTRSVSRCAARHGMAANRTHQYTGFRCVVPSGEASGDLRITIVYDNTAYDSRLRTEWGFAALIEYRGQTLLFDTGGDAPALLGNMEVLEIDPTSIQTIVLSHIHGDHTGGLEGLLQTGVRPTVYVPPAFPGDFKRRVEAITDLVEVTPGQAIAKGILTTGAMVGGSVHEQALVIQTGGGLVIVTGCAHPGIVSIVRRATELFDDPVRLVMGGFHLLDKRESQIQAIVSDFRQLGVAQVAPTHCTGEEAIAAFADEYGDDYIQAGVGRVIVFEDEASATAATGTSTATVGLYADEGAAEACVTAATRMFEWMGYTVEQIFADTVNDEDIGRFDLLYFPGGSSDPFKADISPEGKDKIRQFVESGGCFIGVCAGALLAAEQAVWEGQVEDGETLALFPGTVEGPIPEIHTDPEYGMCQVNLEPHTITAGEQESIQILYYNGPFFKPNPGAQVDVIGRYQIGNEPALVASEYGQGRVFLAGPHPEWEEDDDRDGVAYFDRFDDQGSEWDLMRNAARWCLHEID